MTDLAQDRSAAWAALHVAETSAAELAAIAAAHPEFADVIARHPHAYPELIAWAQAVRPDAAPRVVEIAKRPRAGEPVSAAPAQPAPAAEPRPAPAAEPRRPSRRAVAISAIVAGAVLVGGGGAWAAVALLAPHPDAASQAAATPADAPTPTAPEPDPQRTLAGPPVYIGDELDTLLVDEATLRRYLPQLSAMSRDDEMGGIGESEGIHAGPAECTPWLLWDSNGFIGVRRILSQDGSLTAYQFPTPAQADEYYRTYADSTAACAQYSTLDSAEQAFQTTTLTLAGSTENGVAVRSVTIGDFGGESVQLYLVEGNAVVVGRFDGAQLDDAGAAGLLDAIAAQATTARAQLTEKIGYR